MISPLTMPKDDRMLFLECPIAGWSFHDLEDDWDELCEGTKLVLVRERNNRYDANAIAVVLEDDYDPDAVADGSFDFQFAIGYVPRTENELMARLMDMGWDGVFTAEISTVKRYGPYADRLRMNIYIQRKEEEPEEKVQRVFAMKLDDENYRLFARELIDKGFAFFRWGGLPVWQRELPKRGDDVVFIHEQQPKAGARSQVKADLYLMKVLADNEEKASFFLPNSGLLHVGDDCQPFVLTCARGPLSVKLSDLGFLDGESVENYQSERPLSPAAAKRMLALFA